MTSTLAVYEPFVANRPTKEPRVLNAMAPAVRDDYLKMRNEIDSTGKGMVPTEGLKTAMAFEKTFRREGGSAGGGGGSDRHRRRPGRIWRPAELRAAHRGGLFPSQGDPDHDTQRRQDPRRGQAARNPWRRGRWPTWWSSKATWPRIRPSSGTRPSVFKDGIGYDSAKLIESVQGRVGIN